MTTTMYQLTLVVADGAHRNRSIRVPRLPFRIGRGPQCHLRLTSALVGERHCGLEDRGGRLVLCDFGSASGTFLNGRRVTRETTVGDGDELMVGPLRFILRVEASPSVSPPASFVAPEGPFPEKSTEPRS